ncbi:MAG: hypothetical protein ACXWLO_07530 [Rhizomicrobium sp.]
MKRDVARANQRSLGEEQREPDGEDCAMQIEKQFARRANARKKRSEEKRP